MPVANATPAVHLRFDDLDEKTEGHKNAYPDRMCGPVRAGGS